MTEQEQKAFDQMREALEGVWLWMENQADGQSKGGHATFDLMMLREQRDIAAAALTAANAVSEQPKPVALQWVAEMIMSDCGCSTNNVRLLERVIGRIEQYERANAPAHPQATEPAWRPIESAPKDGTHILAVLPDSDTCYVICWSDPKACIRSELGGEVDEIGWRVAFDGFLFASHEQPSHWMPLPAAPEAK